MSSGFSAKTGKMSHEVPSLKMFWDLTESSGLLEIYGMVPKFFRTFSSPRRDLEVKNSLSKAGN